MSVDANSVVSGVGMLAIGAGSVGLWWTRWQRAPDQPGIPGRFYAFGTGAVAWLLGGLVLKAFAGGVVDRLNGRVPLPLYWLALGLLTGVFECGVVLLMALLLRGLRHLSWEGVVAFGIAFGAIEAAVVSLDAFFPDRGSSQSIATAQSPGALTEVLAPILERANAMPVHAFACALVLYAVSARRPSAFWGAFAYKTIVDGLPVETLAPLGPWAMELLYLPFGIAGILGLVVLARRWSAIETPGKNCTAGENEVPSGRGGGREGGPL